MEEDHAVKEKKERNCQACLLYIDHSRTMFIVEAVVFLSAIWAVRADDAEIPNSRGISYPTTRFETWENLEPMAQSAAEDMGYSSTQWNSPGTFSLERTRYSSLDSASQDALGQLNMDAEVWDCYVNHYRGYAWTDIESEGLDSYYISLGFDETRWETDSGFVAQIDGRLWNELSTMEQTAAGELCYFEELWNGLEIGFWNQALTVSPSVSVTNNPTQSPSALPTSALTTSPTSSPTAIPPVSTPVLPVRIDPVDSIRYVPWDELSDDVQTLATSLGYEMESWNLPGSAQIEAVNFATLKKNARQTVNNMGLTEDQWDCYINHYEGFAWDDLSDEIIAHLETLGWDSTLWESGEEVPSTRNQAWDDLNSSEREAAVALCYRYETWEMINLEDWNTVVSPSIAPNGVPTSAPSKLQEEAESIGTAADVSLYPTASSTPVASVAPTAMDSDESSSVPTNAFSFDSVPLSTMILFWDEASEPLESNAFERSIVDYLTASFVIAARSSVTSVDASVILVDNRSAIVTGLANFAESSSKLSQADLEDLLIVHFASTGTDALLEFLIDSGFGIKGPLRVEVAGYDTSRPSPIQTNQDDADFPWLIIVVVAMSLVALAAAAVLVFTVRRKPLNPDRQVTPVYESFRASTAVSQSQLPPPSGMQEPDMDDYSVDQSLYTTDDSYLQAVRD